MDVAPGRELAIELAIKDFCHFPFDNRSGQEYIPEDNTRLTPVSEWPLGQKLRHQ
jgi:hypothetical protein